MGLGRRGSFLLPVDDEAQVEARAALLATRPGEVEGVLAGQPAAVHHLLAQGRSGQDDVCALRPDGDGTFRLVGAVLCFPSHWVLHDKLGRPVTEVHAPVPGYRDHLAGRVDAFLARLRPGQVAARRNRTLHERADLFAPVRPEPDGRPLAEWWLRSERQALSRVAGSDVVGFSIRTTQIRLRDLPAPTAHRLAAHLAAEPGELSAYRGYLDQRDALVALLTAVTEGP